MRPFFRLCVLSMLLWAAAASLVHAETDGLRITLVPGQGYYYEGDIVSVRLILRNEGDTTLRNPARKGAASGIEIRTSGGEPVDARAAKNVRRPDIPRDLEPGAHHQQEIDLSGVEALGRAGRYELSWSASGTATASTELTVLQRFDRSKGYTAQVETDQGRIDFKLFVDVSPLAVKAFVDLARAGHYDGSRFSETVADSHVVGGPVARGPRPQHLPAEISDVVILPGTVVMKPAGPAPPANGSEFVVALSPQPAWTGQVTVLGQVSRGIEVVQRISRLPSAGGREQTRILTVRIAVDEP